MSGSRRLARQYAFIVLCSIDLAQIAPRKALSNFWVSSSLDENLEPDQRPLVQRSVKEGEKEFAERLVIGVHKNLSAIDEQIQLTAHNWSLERMAMADRNLLRLGVFELLFDRGTPKSICINEAVELAKKFGEHTSIKGLRAQSATFVNGVLDTIAKKSKKLKTKKGQKSSSKLQSSEHSTVEEVDLTKRRKGTWANPEEAEVESIRSDSANTSTDGTSDNMKAASDSNTGETTPIDFTRRRKGTAGPSVGQPSTNKKPKHRLHTRHRKSRVSNESTKTSSSDSKNTPSVDVTKRKKGSWDSDD